MAAQGRTFGASSAVVAAAVAAFTRGLRDARVAATVKHFPGIGAARQNTDQFAIRIGLNRSVLDRSLEPFKAALDSGAPLVMVSNASYAALDRKPAAWSPAVQRLLRVDLGFTGATITDALDGAAATRGLPLSSAAVLAAQAGVDLLLVIGTESSSEARLQQALFAAAQQGRIPPASLQRSYARDPEPQGRLRLNCADGALRSLYILRRHT
jgi:beta-N-acetylhexosaminidase